MTAIEDRQIGTDRHRFFIRRAIEEIGATLNTALVVLGDQLGYYRALAGAGPLTPTDLAECTGTDEVCAREWLQAQAASGYLDYHPAIERFSLPPEHAVALADTESPEFLPGLFQLAEGTVRESQRFLDVARSGVGVSWGERNSAIHDSYERTLQPEYHAHLAHAWLPALYSVADKLQRGAHVADVGCGQGTTTVLMAEAFPHAWFTGFDPHPESIDVARARANAAEVQERVRFEVVDAEHFPGKNYDLIATFNSLHRLGDPKGAGRHIRRAIATDGTWMIVEPRAGDRLEDNLGPIGRLYYGFSTLLGTPASLSLPVGEAIGSQAGPARLRAITEAAGFRRFRQAAQSRYSMVLEARP